MIWGLPSEVVIAAAAAIGAVATKAFDHLRGRRVDAVNGYEKLVEDLHREIARLHTEIGELRGQVAEFKSAAEGARFSQLALWRFLGDIAAREGLEVPEVLRPPDVVL